MYRPYRNQAEGAEAGAGGRGATSHAATGSSPPSGGGRGGGPSPQPKRFAGAPKQAAHDARLRIQRAARS